MNWNDIGISEMAVRRLGLRERGAKCIRCRYSACAASCTGARHAGPGGTVMATDRKNRVWLAGQDGGVVSYDGHSWKTYTTKNGLASNEVSAIVADERGRIWFASENRVSVLEEANKR